MIYLVYLITGLVSWVVGGLLGTWGCAIMMPVIRFWFHFDPAIAVGTTLLAVVFTAWSWAYQHIKMKNVDKKTAWIIAISWILWVIIGSFVFDTIKDYGMLIDMILWIAFLIVSLRMIVEWFFWKQPKNPTEEQMPGKKSTKSILGTVVGFLTGIIGLGGGYALVPSFLYFFNAPMKLAIWTSMASFLWIAIVGAAFKIYEGVVDIPVAITLGIGALIGAIYGAKLVKKIKSKTLKALFGIMFLYVSLKYILLYFGLHI